MYAKIYIVIVLIIFHILFGVISIFTGILSTLKVNVWTAHTISPIWSGNFVSLNLNLSLKVPETLKIFPNLIRRVNLNSISPPRAS